MTFWNEEIGEVDIGLGGYSAVFSASNIELTPSCELTELTILKNGSCYCSSGSWCDCDCTIVRMTDLELESLISLLSKALEKMK